MLGNLLNSTPAERLVDAKGRPYFLWDVDVTLDGLRERLASPDQDIRTYWLAKLMRQAKPDDVFSFASVDEIVAAWPTVRGYLGKSQEFWTWIVATWERQGRVHQ
jgi:hypothetical protein